MMNHFNKTVKSYHRLLRDDEKTNGCHFCVIGQNEAVLDSNDTMLIVRNRTAYDMFEGFRVLDHLLIIPKQHRLALADFTEGEVSDYVQLLAAYESKSYSVYSRGVGSVSRSVAHLHTHLIQLSDKAVDTVVYNRKPYLLIAK